MQTENEQGLLRRSDALTLEEIQASTDLSGKIASASSVKELNGRIFSRSTSLDIPMDFTGIYQVPLLDYLYSEEYALVSVTVLNRAENPDHAGEFLGYIMKKRIEKIIVCEGHGSVGISVTDNAMLNISKNFTWSGLRFRVTVI